MCILFYCLQIFFPNAAQQPCEPNLQIKQTEQFEVVWEMFYHMAEYFCSCSYWGCTGFEECAKNVVFLDKAYCCLRGDVGVNILYSTGSRAWTMSVTFLPIRYVSRYHRHNTIYILIFIAIIKVYKKVKNFEFENESKIYRYFCRPFPHTQGPKLQSLVSHDLDHAFRLFFPPLYYFQIKTFFFILIFWKEKRKYSYLSGCIDLQKNTMMHWCTDVSSQP
jgi:hypothetical protein